MTVSWVRDPVSIMSATSRIAVIYVRPPLTGLTATELDQLAKVDDARRQQKHDDRQEHQHARGGGNQRRQAIAKCRIDDPRQGLCRGRAEEQGHDELIDRDDEGKERTDQN